MRDALIAYFEAARLSQPRESARRCLDYFEQRSGLLVPDESDSYVFAHLTLQEHCAGRHMLLGLDAADLVMQHRANDRWREPLFLGLGLVQKTNPALIDRILSDLIDPEEIGCLKAAERRQRDLILAAEIGQDRDWNYLRTQRVNAERLQRDLKHGLIEVLNDRGQLLPMAERVQAGLLLGNLGDPRFEKLLPPTVHVAAGPYPLGSQEGYEDEGPQQQVDVPAFDIGIYSVTYQEYARFLVDSLGHPHPHYWYDIRFNNASQPVIGVTWHDATAYCKWLTDRLQAADLLPNGMVVRLPLEVEWEKAAAWDPMRRIKHRYPWGDEWSSARANTADKRNGWLTAPVGCYPAGISAYGVHDMIGNVWEWMANEYTSYPGAPVPFHEEGSYVLRGLSCASLPGHARCEYRSRLPAGYWRYHVGFRIVIAHQ